MNIIGIYNAPARVSMLGLISSVCACALTLGGHHEFALVALIWAGIFDLFDGWVARRCSLSETESRFGMHIDSIVDVVSFGIAPAMIVSSLHDNVWGFVIAVFYVCAAAQRLAYFNVLRESESAMPQFYLGLPVTFAALIFPVALSLLLLLPAELAAWYANGLLLITGLLYIIPFKMPKPKGMIYVFMPLLAVVFTGFWLWQGIRDGIHFA